MSKKTTALAQLAVIVAIAALFVVFNQSEKENRGSRSPVPERPWPAPSSAPVELARNPMARNFYIVLDGSGSMAYAGCSESLTKSKASKSAIEKFLPQVPPDANLGLLTFDSQGVREVVPLGIDNRDKFLDNVRRSLPGGETPLRSAISLASQKLEEQARKQLGYGEYTMVVVTDGEASRGEEPDAVVEDILLNSPVSMQVIGFCIDEAHSLNQPGRTVYRSAQSANELLEGLGQVLAESEDFDVSAFTKVQ